MCSMQLCRKGVSLTETASKVVQSTYLFLVLRRRDTKQKILNALSLAGARAGARVEASCNSGPHGSCLGR